jgi:hypothetical protein
LCLNLFVRVEHRTSKISGRNEADEITGFVIRKHIPDYHRK